MPRPNKPRDVLAEDNLARRIAAERDARGWTNDGLAKRMTDVGCAMTGSAIFKIEKGEPRRRIVVDELVAFARVFGLSIGDLLLPPELAAERAVGELLIAWNTAADAAAAADKARDDAWEAIRAYLAEHADQGEAIESMFGKWADFHFDESQRTAAAALKMWELTREEKWLDLVYREIDHGQHR